MSASDAALQVDIQLSLQQFQLNFSFQAQHEIVVLFGPSGAGKTSVLDCIAGFRRPSAGGLRLQAHSFLQREWRKSSGSAASHWLSLAATRTVSSSFRAPEC